MLLLGEPAVELIGEGLSRAPVDGGGTSDALPAAAQLIEQIPGSEAFTDVVP